MTNATESDPAAPVGQELVGATLVLTIRAPRRRNALSSAVRAGIHAGLSRADTDHEIRSVVLTGDGSTFSAGGDFVEDFGPLASGSRQDANDVIDAYFSLFDHIERCRVPVITAVNGGAIGGGLELVMASDLAVAADTATFAPIEGRAVGAPSGWTLLRAAERLTHKFASELVLTGAVVDAHAALSWGVVNRVVPPSDLMSTALRWGEAVAANSAHAVTASKTYLHDHTRAADPAVVRDLVVAAFATPESAAAIARFFDTSGAEDR